MPAARVASSADVDASAHLGEGCVVWHLAQVREAAALGADCVIGRGAYIGAGVHLGARCKVQNYALVYEPADLSDGVFIGPAAVLTNDEHPRAITPEGALKGSEEWKPVGVIIERGASIGARAVCVAPVLIGAWATVGAGAVVTRDVPAHALVVGVPARQVGWVGEVGEPLQREHESPRNDAAEAEDVGPGSLSGRWICPATGTAYLSDGASLKRVDTHADVEVEGV
ncbi:MAG: acyltransferase [Ornithinimicrobium sp.]